MTREQQSLMYTLFPLLEMYHKNLQYAYESYLILRRLELGPVKGLKKMTAAELYPQPTEWDGVDQLL